MAGWVSWGPPTGPDAVVQACMWRDGLVQLGLSCAAAVLLQVLLYCLHLRRCRTSGSATDINALVDRHFGSGHLRMHHGACPAEESAAVGQGIEEVAKQLQPCLVSLLGDAAAKQLLHNLAVAQAQQDATSEAAPVAYAGVTTLVPVSIKVDAPHERIHEIGPGLLHTLSTTLDSAAAGQQQEGSSGSMLLGAAAVFQGCVQLLATVLQLRQLPVGAAAEEGAAADPVLQLGQEQAQQLVQETLQALQVVGSGGHQAAAAVGGHVAAGQGSSRSNVCSTQQPGVQPVTLVCLDPPCAAEGAAMALDIHLQTSSSNSINCSKGGGCATGRLVVYSAAGLLVDVAKVPVEERIRLDLPGLPAGVYHVALLPASPTTAPHGMAAACRPLFTHPLLALPPAASVELHTYWRRAVSTAAVKGASASQAAALSRHGGDHKPCDALQHVWETQLSSLVCDLAAVILYSGAGQAPPPPQQRQQQQLPSIGAVLLPAHFDAGAIGHLLEHLLSHLCAQQLRELTAVVTSAGKALAATRQVDAEQAQQPASPTSTPAAKRGAGGSSDAAGVVAPPSIGAGVCLAGGSRASRALVTAGGAPVPAGGGNASSSRACSAPLGMPAPSAAEELAAAGTWAGTWRHLAAGFADARLEAGYLEYVFDNTLPADMAAAPFFLIVAAGHGLLTDPFTADAPIWQQVVLRLLFVAMFGVPAVLLMVNRHSLRQRGRRERARRLVDAGLALAPYVVLLGRLHTLPTMARLLHNHGRSWAILVVGQGAFTMCCRQTRTRTWLPVTAWDYLGWFAAAVLVQGRVLMPALRSVCVALAALACSVVLEMRSRRHFLKQLLQVADTAVAAAAAKGHKAYGKPHID